MKEDTNWNDNWINELKKYDYKCWERLCECKNVKEDIIIMAKLNYKYNPYRHKDDCLDRILDWVTDWNNQPELYPVNTKEYDRILNRI